MKKYLLPLFLIGFLSMELFSGTPFYKRKNMKISVFYKILDEKISLNISVENYKKESCYIPREYLDFYKVIDNKLQMKNNWLEIIDNDGNKINYFGIISDSFLKTDDDDMFLLEKNQKYIIHIDNILQNYEISEKMKWIKIRYFGPLGVSKYLKIPVAKLFK